MKTEATEQEREALRRWYGAELAPRMEAVFCSATSEACEEAASLDGPSFEEFGASKRAARRAAWDIINRARDAREAAAAGGAR